MSRVITQDKWPSPHPSFAQRLDRLERLKPVTGADWTTPTFTNSWTGINCAYLKDPLGFVHLRGQVNNGTSATAAFTLLDGFRPGITDYYPCLQQAGTAGSYVLISTAGVVTPTYSAGTGVYLNGLTFLAEN